MAVSRNKSSSKMTAQRPRKPGVRRSAAESIKNPTAHGLLQPANEGAMIKAESDVDTSHTYDQNASAPYSIDGEIGTSHAVNDQVVYLQAVPGVTQPHFEAQADSEEQVQEQHQYDGYDDEQVQGQTHNDGCIDQDGTSASPKTQSYNDLAACANQDFTLVPKKEGEVDMQYYSQSAASMVQQHDVSGTRTDNDEMEGHLSTQSTISSSRAILSPMLPTFIHRSRQGSAASMHMTPSFGAIPARGRGGKLNSLSLQAPIYTADRFSACMPCRKRKIRCIPSGTSHIYDVDGKNIGVCATCIRRKKECCWPDISVSFRSVPQLLPAGVSPESGQFPKSLANISGRASILLPPAAVAAIAAPKSKKGKRGSSSIPDSAPAQGSAPQDQASPSAPEISSMFSEEDAQLLERFSLIQDDTSPWDPLPPSEQPLVPSMNHPDPDALHMWSAGVPYGNEPRHMPSPALTQSPGSSSKTFASPLPTPCEPRFAESYADAMMMMPSRFGAMQHASWPPHSAQGHVDYATSNANASTWDQPQDVSYPIAANDYYTGSLPGTAMSMEPSLPSTQSDVYLASQDKASHAQGIAFPSQTSMGHGTGGQADAPHSTHSGLAPSSAPWATASTPPPQQQSQRSSESSRKCRSFNASPDSQYDEGEMSSSGYGALIVPANPCDVYKDFIPSSA